ncbi:MAG TPA: hypothetical protein DD733_00765, partial [Clostridiales bacterium]|nr:hypothetical protein [Clostridiales bacterium]
KKNNRDTEISIYKGSSVRNCPISRYVKGMLSVKVYSLVLFAALINRTNHFLCFISALYGNKRCSGLDCLIKILY